jgi:chorismate mutase
VKPKALRYLKAVRGATHVSRKTGDHVVEMMHNALHDALLSFSLYIPTACSVEMMHNALHDALCTLPYAVHRRLAH